MKFSFRPKDGDGEAKAPNTALGPMRSVLVKRAVMFAAVLLIVALVIGTIVEQVTDRAIAVNRGRRQMAAVLESAAATVLPDENVDLANGYAAGLRADGITRPGTVTGFGTSSLSYSGELPEAATDAEQFGMALTLGARVYTITDPNNGKAYIRGVTKIDTGTDIPMLFVVDMPVSAFGSGAAAVLIALLAAIVCSGLICVPLAKRMLYPNVESITALRDSAARAARGELETRADETAPDVIGETARALNGLSTELSRNMYMLIVERNRLQNMLDGLSEGIVAIDSFGEITHVNPAITKMFEQKRIGVGLPDARMKVIPDKTVWEDFDAVKQSGEAVTRNINYRDLVIHMTLTPIVDEIGTIAGVVGLFGDITQMERLERTRREYVSNVSHELRTPLTAVRGLIEALKDGMVKEEADRMRYYDIILRETLRLSRLINDQLELSRLQSGSVAIEKQRMNSLDDLIYDVCDRYQSIAEDHGLALNIESDLSGIPSVWANSDRVEQILIILVDNAIKYTEKGSVNVSAVWDAEKVTISVRDTGIGISEEDLPYVFDRFYKVDKAHSGKGSGLGLSILTELLNRMHETINVESEKDAGSTFSFTIHREPAPEELEEKTT